MTEIIRLFRPEMRPYAERGRAGLMAFNMSYLLFEINFASNGIDMRDVFLYLNLYKKS